LGNQERRRINGTLGMRNREWVNTVSNRFPLEYVLYYLKQKDTQQLHPAADFLQTFQSVYTTHSLDRGPRGGAGLLSSSVCKAQPCAGCLNQLRLRNSEAEHTQRRGWGNNHCSWHLSSELFSSRGVLHEYDYIASRLKLTHTPSATLATKIQH